MFRVQVWVFAFGFADLVGFACVHGLGAWICHLSRDQNPLLGNPLPSGSKELAGSKRVGFVSYCKQNRSACCAVIAVSSTLGFSALPP